MTSKSTSPGEITEYLASLPLFSKVDESLVQVLARSARFRHIERGEILFFQSDASDAAYIVRTGRISVVLNSPDGREMVIEEMRPGELFGELGVLTKNVRSACAVARSNSELLVIPADLFVRVVDAEPRVARRVLDLVAQRLQMSSRRELALAFMDAQARLARHLLLLEEQEQDKGYVTASQEELARGTGLIRQTVAKALGQWRRDGWLLTGRGRILILNRKALEAVERGPAGLTVVSSK